jgi:BNR repeat protein
MRIKREGRAFEGAPGSGRQSATFPLACVSAQGRWYCAFRAAPEKVSNRGQRVLLTWSDDGGTTWSEVVEPFAAPDVEGRAGSFRCAGLTCLGNGRLLAVLSWVEASEPDVPYFNETTEGLLDTRIFISEFLGDESAWSVPRLIDTSPFNVPTPITGPILELPGGEWACQFELNKPYDDPAPWRHASVLTFSQDEGRNWSRHSIVTQDPDNRMFYWDQRPAVLPDGRLLDVFWTFNRQTAEYLNIHACESSDRGRTWSDLWDTGVPGQPGPVFALEDGMLAMPFVDRTAAPVIKLRQSVDGGHTWPADGELVVYESEGPTQTASKSSMQDAWSEMYHFSVGLPNVAPLPGGGALLVYYAGLETDVTSIRWAVVV